MFVVFFYFFSVIAIISAILAVSSKNPIYSVLFLILVFLSGSSLLLLVRIDFLAIVFIIIYAGAIMILFLFVVMMLNVNLVDLSSNYINYIPFSMYFLIFFMCEIKLYFFLKWERLDVLTSFKILKQMEYVDWYKVLNDYGNIKVLGAVFYSYYDIYVILSGIILLIGLVSAIVLTRKKREQNMKRRSFYLDLLEKVEEDFRKNRKIE